MIILSIANSQATQEERDDLAEVFEQALRRATANGKSSMVLPKDVYYAGFIPDAALTQPSHSTGLQIRTKALDLAEIGELEQHINQGSFDARIVGSPARQSATLSGDPELLKILLKARE